MVTAANPDRSLDLCAIGLGQAGGNLAAEWRRRGYRALVLNTAQSDLRGLARGSAAGLEIPERHQLYIGLDGAEGAGRDPALGRAAIEQHAEDIRAAAARHLEGADAIVLMAGLGGGTGSAVDALVRALRPLDVPLLTLTTLPGDAESGIAKVNAVKSVNAVVEADLDGRVFVDNARLAEAFPGLDAVGYYPKVNARVLQPLDDLNRLNARDDLSSIKSFDGEDLRKLLLSGGVLQALVAKMPERASAGVTADDLVDAVVKCVDGGDLFASGLTLEQTAYLALVVTGPEKALKATAMAAFDEAARTLKKRTGGGAVYEGIYVGPDDQPLRAYVLASSLALPRRVQSLLQEAHKEGGALAEKIRSQIPTIATDPIDQLELFRAPSPRRRGTTQPPTSTSTQGRPKPRPIDVQIAADQPPPPESTILVDEDAVAPSGVPVARTPSVVRQPDPDLVPRIGTGRWGEASDEKEYTATAVVDEAGAARMADALAHKPSGMFASAVAGPHVHPPIDSDDDDGPEGHTGPTKPGLSPADRPPTRAAPLERTEVGTPGHSEADQVLRSLGGGLTSVAELQGVYEDLIDRFRQAPDRRGRERVARRLIDDSRSEDVEVRALAVWAMVKLGEPGFRRALAKAANDGNPEISKLALTGLERIGALNEPAT